MSKNINTGQGAGRQPKPTKNNGGKALYIDICLGL